MRHALILTVTLMAIGCSSHSATPAPQTRSQPQVFQHHGGETWLYFATKHVEFGLIHWHGRGMTLSSNDGHLFYITEDGGFPSQPIPIGGGEHTVGPDGNLWIANEIASTIEK